jgi:hypothetical protein
VLILGMESRALCKHYTTELHTRPCLFLTVLEFEVRALCLLGKCSTAWTTPSSPFIALDLFQVSLFTPRADLRLPSYLWPPK